MRECALPRPSVSSLPKPPKLRCNDILFVTEYLSNGRNATRAYQKIHPNSTYQAARRSASDVLTKPVVQQEIARRIQYEGGITKALLESTLLQALAWANQAHDPLAVATVAMDCAKLAGLITEKREVKSISVEESSAIRDLVRASLRPIPPGSMPPASDSVCVTPNESGALASEPATGGN